MWSVKRDGRLTHSSNDIWSGSIRENGMTLLDRNAFWNALGSIDIDMHDELLSYSMLINVYSNQLNVFA